MFGFNGKAYYCRIAQEYIRRLHLVDSLHPTLTPEHWRWIDTTLEEMQQESAPERICYLSSTIGLLFGELVIKVNQAGYSYNELSWRLDSTNAVVRGPARRYRQALEEGYPLPWHQEPREAPSNRQSVGLF